MLLIILMISSTLCQHTEVYNQHWNENHNNNYYFYDPMTFGMDYDPCQKLDNTTKFKNKDFKIYISEQVQCLGEWCTNDGYFCKGDNKNCYNVEHMIDENGPELKDYDKNIFGNLVMAYGLWNQQLGWIAWYDYSASAAEKEEVYGKDRMDKARNLIMTCNQPNTINIAVIIALVIATIVLCAIYPLYRCYNNAKEREFSKYTTPLV